MGIVQMIQELQNQACGGRSVELRTLRCLRRSLGGGLVITNVEGRGPQREQAISAPRVHFSSKCCHKSIAEPSGLAGKTVLVAPPGKAFHLIIFHTGTCCQFYLGST